MAKTQLDALRAQATVTIKHGTDLIGDAGGGGRKRGGRRVRFPALRRRTEVTA